MTGSFRPPALLLLPAAPAAASTSIVAASGRPASPPAPVAAVAASATLISPSVEMPAMTAITLYELRPWLSPRLSIPFGAERLRGALLVVAGLAHYTRFGFAMKPTAWSKFLGGGGDENITINHGCGGGDCGVSGNSDGNSDGDCGDCGGGDGGDSGGRESDGGGRVDDSDERRNERAGMRPLGSGRCCS